MNPIHRLRQEEDGSLVFTLLAALVIGGVVLALFSVTTASTDAARRDRDFSRAIQVSDAGLQQAFTVLAQMGDTGDPDPALMSGTLEEGTYTWTAERRGTASWNVRVEGEVNGVTRVLEAEMGQSGIFDLAAYSEEVFTSGGTERFGSYSGSGECTAGLGNCRGWVGSNAGFEIGSRSADRAQLFAGAAVNAPTNVNTPAGVTRLTTEPAYPDLAAAAFDDGPCAGVTPQAFTFPGSTPFQEGRVYCATDVTFQKGRHDLAANPSNPGEPAVFYMTGALNLVGNGGGGGNSDFDDYKACNASKVACVNLGNGSAPPDATKLQFYIREGGASTGFGTGNNHGMIAAAIYAPWASCNLSAQTGVWGAMVCGQISGNGNWALYFDERLAGINKTAFNVEAWREEVGDTTSFGE